MGGAAGGNGRGDAQTPDQVIRGVAGLGYEGGHDAVVATQDRTGSIRARRLSLEIRCRFA